MKFQFYLRFYTRPGQSLWLSGDAEELGNSDLSLAIPLEYLNDEFWFTSIEIKRKAILEPIAYKYFLRNAEGEWVAEWGNDRLIDESFREVNEVQFVDTWNHAGEYENAFFSAPFRNVLLNSGPEKKTVKSLRHYSHIFKVKAPLLQKNESVCISGNGPLLGDWSETNPLLLAKDGDWWSNKIDLSDSGFPVAYKYGVYNTKEKKFVRFENGDNRLLYSEAAKKKITVTHDGFVRLPNDTWKGAGVAIPVFSLRSKNSFGVGEFTDIKLLVDWARACGLKLIQLLPINDTIATNTWMDSYPYAAISAFALHPLYINLSKVAGKQFPEKITLLRKKQKQLNALPEVDYEEVIRFKTDMMKELYEVMGKECFESEDYKQFFESNKHWLQPYASFCYFRDKYGTSQFEEWRTNGVYDKEEIAKLWSPKSASYRSLRLYLFIQYHLHLQLKDAVDYAHKKGIVLKGDIPIGIYRNGCDAWVAPEQYNMDWQAGAPPDDFTWAGQNWGFPTYNWKKMQEDHFAWWKQRFEQMSNYFDAFRIDHILGFFRIWSIPAHAEQGIMGHFVACLPVHFVEFGENGIWFDYQRYCKPFINDVILYDVFGDLADRVRGEFLVPNELGGYDLEYKFLTQHQVKEHFNTQPESEENERLMQGLYELIANVILFEEENSQEQEFHFRIAMEKTHSYRHLIPHVQGKLYDLYINYFYRRQDHFWKKEAMHKLPPLKSATNMLVCGEDLGMVPHCVPEVMQELGILSLEIQRMPKDPKKEFFHPATTHLISPLSHPARMI